MKAITKKLYAIFDKDSSVRITNVDGTIEQGKIKSVNDKMVGLQREDMTRKVIIISRIKNIEEIDNASR